MVIKLKKVQFSHDLRKGFVRSSIVIKYNPIDRSTPSIYITHYLFGIIEIDEGIKSVHTWETESQAQSGSYLSRRYPVTLMNGINNDSDFELNFLGALSTDIKEFSNDLNDEIFLDVIKQIRCGNSEIRLLRLPD